MKIFWASGMYMCYCYAIQIIIQIVERQSNLLCVGRYRSFFIGSANFSRVQSRFDTISLSQAKTKCGSVYMRRRDGSWLLQPIPNRTGFLMLLKNASRPAIIILIDTQTRPLSILDRHVYAHIASYKVSYPVKEKRTFFVFFTILILIVLSKRRDIFILFLFARLIGRQWAIIKRDARLIAKATYLGISLGFSLNSPLVESWRNE